VLETFQEADFASKISKKFFQKWYPQTPLVEGGDLHTTYAPNHDRDLRVRLIWQLATLSAIRDCNLRIPNLGHIFNPESPESSIPPDPNILELKAVVFLCIYRHIIGSKVVINHHNSITVDILWCFFKDWCIFNDVI